MVIGEWVGGGWVGRRVDGWVGGRARVCGIFRSVTVRTKGTPRERIADTRQTGTQPLLHTAQHRSRGLMVGAHRANPAAIGRNSTPCRSPSARQERTLAGAAGNVQVGPCRRLGSALLQSRTDGNLTGHNTNVTPSNGARSLNKIPGARQDVDIGPGKGESSCVHARSRSLPLRAAPRDGSAWCSGHTCCSRPPVALHAPRASATQTSSTGHLQPRAPPPGWAGAASHKPNRTLSTSSPQTTWHANQRQSWQKRDTQADACAAKSSARASTMDGRRASQPRDTRVWREPQSPGPRPVRAEGKPRDGAVAVADALKGGGGRERDGGGGRACVFGEYCQLLLFQTFLCVCLFFAVTYAGIQPRGTHAQVLSTLWQLLIERS